jgi:hypothetical protein
MDAGSSKLLYDLVDTGAASLLQYVRQASLFSTDPIAIARVHAAADQERGELTRFTRLLQRKHEQIPMPGSFPSHFTTMNFVTLAFVLPKLIAEHEQEIARIESELDLAGDEDIRKLAAEFIALKRRNLETFKNLAQPKSSAAA